MEDFIDEEDVKEVKKEGGKFLKLLRRVLVDSIANLFKFILNKIK